MGQCNPKTILFISTGNYLAGRCAEVLFNSVAVKMGLPWEASSRMLALEADIKNVTRMSPDAVSVVTKMGLRVTDELTHAPAPLSSDDLETAERIVAMDQVEHLPLLQERFPAWAERLEYWEIDESLEAWPGSSMKSWTSRPASSEEGNGSRHLPQSFVRSATSPSANAPVNRGNQSHGTSR